MTASKAEMSNSSSTFQELSRDMSLYKFQRQNIENQLSDIKKELEFKLPKNDFFEMRLLFDSQIATLRDKNDKNNEELRSILGKEAAERRIGDIKVEETIKKNLIIQSKHNQECNNQLKRLQMLIDSNHTTLRQKIEINLQNHLNL